MKGWVCSNSRTKLGGVGCCVVVLVVGRLDVCLVVLLVVRLVVCLVVCLVVGLVVGLVTGLVVGLKVGLVVGLVAGLVAGLLVVSGPRCCLLRNWLTVASIVCSCSSCPPLPSLMKVVSLCMAVSTSPGTSTTPSTSRNWARVLTACNRESFSSR